jgi:beta-N-acetylhexosaminidase
VLDIVMDDQNLSLETQVAQLFMVGYSGVEPNPITHRFLERGVGGLIFFRDNFDSLQPQTGETVKNLLSRLGASIPAHMPRPLFGIDQEGGQVERLAHTLFPTALTPRAVALASQPDKLAADMYDMLAQHLVALGFHLNFFPTLDVNFSRKNPIIGVRSFGDDAKTVWKYSKIALQAFEQAGLIAVGKHFPGHGNGTVDSHLDLPTLNFTEEELTPFRQAIEAGVPAMLVAHGFYPALQTTEFEKSVPSSASPAIIQGLLRQQCGFNGVVMTDDMCMGAITKHCSPVEAALASLKAGVDILLYKQSTEDEWAVYEAVLDAFRTGALPMEQLHGSVERILAMKAKAGKTTGMSQDISPAQARQQADEIARRGISVLHGDPALLPFRSEAPLLLIHPDRQRMGNYAFDVPTSEPLDALVRQAGFSNMESLTYPPTAAFDATTLADSIQSSPGMIVLVTFNPLIQTSQADLYRNLQTRFPHTPIILASAGTPYDLDALPNPALHLGLCSYRPATLRALAQVMASGLSSVAAPVPTGATEPL